MNRPKLDSLLGCAVETAQTAGQHALTHYNRRAETVKRTAHDVKLQLDMECQERASEIVRQWYPSHAILGEEGGEMGEADGVTWIIDPIDGSVNFTHGLPVWCCSVAVMSRGEILAGAVFAPMLQELFTATVESPTERNGSAIRVSSVSALAEASVAISLAPREADGGRSLGILGEVLPFCQKTRNLGSAAMDLCYVASGAFDAYAESGINLWDVAAGGLFVQQAGGTLEVLETLDNRRMRMIATNGVLHSAFAKAIRRGLALPETPAARPPSPWGKGGR
jgi:myo-inositol-1(or 4)-monophosphatase